MQEGREERKKKDKGKMKGIGKREKIDFTTFARKVCTPNKTFLNHASFFSISLEGEKK